MKIGSGGKYLTNVGYDNWKVTWWAPGDNYVSMRSGESSRSKRLAKIYTGTMVSGHSGCGCYLNASVEAWVAVRTASGKVYLR